MVIYIHGIGEHPPKEQWKREWDIALFGKPIGDQTTMAYPSADDATADPSAGDRDGHGTHVCGIIAGEYLGPGRHLQGIAAQAKLVVYKVLDDAGFGNDAWIIKAIDHIFHQNQSVASGLKVHGVNLSLGGPFDASVYGCGFSPICKEHHDV